MQRKIKPIFVLAAAVLFGFVFSACNRTQIENAISVGFMENINAEALKSSVQRHLKKISDSGTLNTYELNFGDTVKQIFHNSEFTISWLEDLTANKGVLLSHIQRLALRTQSHGLDPNYYHQKYIEFCEKRIRTGRWDTADKIPMDSVAMLLLLTADASMGLYHDLSCGRFQPEYTGSLDKLPRRKCGNLRSLPGSDTISKTLNSCWPSFFPYVNLQKEYERVLRLKDTAAIPKLVLTKNLKSLSSVQIRSLARRLRLHGYLELPDSLLLKKQEWDADLENALLGMQLQHFPEPSLKLDKATCEALNADRSLMLLRLKVNLERWRWLGPVSDSSRVWVNIAENKLYAWRDDTLRLEMKVCTGANRDEVYYSRLAESAKDPEKTAPDNLETPLLKAKINQFVANPVWHVPRNIMVKEMLPHLQKDPGYLGKHNYRLLDLNNNEINPLSVNWKKVTKDKWRYKVEQMPGPENALGRVVVHFPNLYSIFMHDTPSQFAFKLDFRHVSHGCVRMEEPLQMVAFLTAFNKKDNYDDVLVSMGLPPEKDSLRRLEFLKIKADSADAFQPIPEKSFRTKIPIPVYLVYFTCGVNPYGGISYYLDGYNRDASMSNPQHRRIKTAPAVQSELKKTVPESYSP